MDKKKYKPLNCDVFMADIIILDKDGTIMDTMGATLEGFIKTMKEHATKERVIEVITRNLGRPPDEQCADILGLPKNHPLVIASVEKLWGFLERVEPKVYGDAAYVIPKLAKDGYILVISTGYRSDIAHAQLQIVGLEKYFALVLGHNPPIVKGKPHMKEIEKIYNLSSDEMGRISIVGDGTGDMKMGNGYTRRLYGIDRIGNAKELIEAGAVKVFPNLREFYSYFSK